MRLFSETLPAGDRKTLPKQNKNRIEEE
jgi:hypothetical protein